MKTKPRKADHPDKQVIKDLGGPAEVARKLGLSPSEGGVQRVHNWMTRGIPSAIKWNHQDVFGEPPAAQQRAG